MSAGTQQETSLADRWRTAIMPTYGVPPIALESGSGVTVTDVGGRSYLDLYAGIAVSALGHAHPAVIEAVTTQVGKLAHVANFVMNTPALELAEKLRALAGGDATVFFGNSGAEANEAAIKIARRTHPGRPGLVAITAGFHGRTMGALSITGIPAKQQPFAPLLPDVTFVPRDDVDALQAAVTERVAAVFIEPVQGEAGIIPLSAEFLRAARERCDATGALLVFDEVQGGIGRAGAWFSHQLVAPGVRPDVITLAKGLGGGLPIGACIGLGAAGSALRPGDHASTFGGNPIAAAAACAVLDTIEASGLLAEASSRGQQLADALVHPGISEVRGIGLWRAAVLRTPVAAAAEAAARRHGALVNAVQPDVLRFAPALVISADEVAQGVGRVLAGLDEVST